MKKVSGLIESISPVIRPKALYSVCGARYVDEETVEIDDRMFTSRVLARNLMDQSRCFPYVVTAGRELDKVTLLKGQSVMLLDLVKNIVVEKAFQYTKSMIVENHNVENITGMSPGHLDDWPIPEQRVLFDLLGADVARIGVELTDAYLMKPLKTVSGIMFSSESRFHSCQVCTQSRCMGRRAGYDPNVAKMFGINPT